MGGLETQIVSLFKDSPSREMSTEDIVHALFPEECDTIREDLDNPVASKERVDEAKRSKAKLHRRVLYYLNKLLDDDILSISREGTRGHKHFILALQPGEELTYGKKKRIVISKPSFSTTHIEGYEQKGIIIKYDPETWVSRLNAVLIESRRFNNLDVLYRSVARCFANVNDVIAFNDFEWIVQSDQASGLAGFLKEMDDDCEDSGRSVCLIIDVTNLEERYLERVFGFLEAYRDLRPRHIRIVFDLSHKELRTFERFFTQVAELFAGERLKLYIKNDLLHTAPYVVGRAGPYTFSEKEWREYLATEYGKAKGIALGQTSLAIDMKRLFSTYSTTEDFRSVIINALHALYSANALQRKRAEDYFRESILLNKPHPDAFFHISRNYLRFWNHTWSHPSFPTETLPELMEDIKKDIKEFCHSQRIIYQACGMPTRFDVVFSRAFRNFRPSMLKEDHTSKLAIRGVEDFHKEETKTHLQRQERMAQLLEGGERLRIYRSGKADGDAVLRELNFLLTTYRIPFLCFDFSDMRIENMSLEEFI